MANRVRILAFGCLHAPITHGPFFNWIIRQIEEFKPDHIVNLGDWYEGLAASRWPRHDEQGWSVYDEHRAVLNQAIAINTASPESKKHWLYGNHDDNLFGSQPNRIPKELREAVQWRNKPENCNALNGWNVIPEYGDRVRLRLGPITFQHGTKTSMAGLRDSSYDHGTPFGLHVSAHTHRPEPITQARERRSLLPYWFCNVGTGIDYSKAFYMQRNSIALWGRGICLIEAPGVSQSRTAYASKQWDAELRLFSR